MKEKNDKILEAKFQEVYKKHLEDMPGYNDLNLNEDMPFIVRTKPRKVYRKLKIASVILAIFICSSAFSIALINGTVEAGKNKILDYINSITGNEHMLSDKSYSFEILDINDLDGIEKANDLMPNFFISGELLDGYIFDNMSIEKINKKDVTIFSQYFKGNELISISQNTLSDDHYVNIEGYYNKETYKGGEIYKIEQSDANVIYWVSDDYTLELISTIDIGLLETILKKEILINPL